MKKQQFLIENHQKKMDIFITELSGSGIHFFWIWIGSRKIIDPDSDLVCTARLDPVNIRPDPKPCP